MDGHVFAVHGDLTQVRAHAVAYSCSTYLQPDGNLYPAFARRYPDFARAYAALSRPRELGEAVWIELPGGDQPAGVVVTVAAGGGHEVDRGTKARDAVVNALTTSIAELRRKRPAPERLLIALPGFRLGMGGDRNIRLESARTQIQAAHSVLARHPGVDVAFVCYAREVYRVFLQARRECNLAPACPAGMPVPAGLLEALRQDRCVIFIGAGLSAGAGMPDWKALVRQLSDAMGLPRRDNGDVDHYLDLAQWFVENHGAAALSDIIATLFGGDRSRPTLAHYLLMSLPVHVVITTNYDTLIERTLRALRRHPITIVEQKDVARTARSEGVCVVKFHGDAATGKGIVLSRDDYDAFFRTRPAMALLLEGLLLNQTFLFVGYGLKDPNFRQIYSRIADMLRGAEREAFALTVDGASETSALLTDQWRRKGLHLLAAPGEDRAGCIHASHLFLDWLADQVTLRAHDLFLAHDVPLEGALVPLQRALIEAAGGEVVRSVAGPLDEREARRVAEVLEFLADHGFRPGRGTQHTLATLWEMLARNFSSPADRRRMLVRALEHAERDDNVRRLEALLEELGRPA